METAFGIVVRDPVEPTNTVLAGSTGDLSAERLRAAARALPPSLAAVADGAARRLAPALRGGDVYTDDRAPVEWLIDASIVHVAADGER
jgi:hypothetical protein